MAAPISTPPDELWKPVSGYEGLYEVSNLGRVRRLPRFQSLSNRWGTLTHRFLAGQILRATLTGRYLCVNLNKDGKGHSTRVNILVCSHFNGPKPFPTACALHGNGDPFDNRATNLRWGTHGENAADRERHGRTAKGERQHSARLTPELVRSIRERVANGEVAARIAKELALNPSSISSVVRRKSWRHIP